MTSPVLRRWIFPPSCCAVCNCGSLRVAGERRARRLAASRNLLRVVVIVIKLSQVFIVNREGHSLLILFCYQVGVIRFRFMIIIQVNCMQCGLMWQKK
jgi:uncharacterized membrane protein (DUF4010 family)